MYNKRRKFSSHTFSEPFGTDLDYVIAQDQSSKNSRNLALKISSDFFEIVYDWPEVPKRIKQTIEASVENLDES